MSEFDPIFDRTMAEIAARRRGKSWVVAMARDAALARSETVVMVMPAPGGGMHSCKVYPFTGAAR